MSEYTNNESAFEALLEHIKLASNNIKRDAGTRFETLIKDWLTQDQSYCDLFSKVETFEEWASSHPELKQSGKDIGIDLVATLDGDPKAYAAIQCKFYDRDATIPKSGIDSFIAASNRDYFKQRYIITTNEKWSENAVTEMQNVTPPIQLIGRSLLASSQIDWSVYLNTGKVVQQKKRTPRKYQEEAIQHVLDGFKTNSRGKLIMACGTGKTFTSMKIAEKMEGENGFVMFLVPSLALLSQTLTDWKRQCAVPIHAFAVCSDATTGKADLKNVDEIMSASDLCYPATTKADRLAEEVKKARSKPGMTVIFSTYQSIEVVSEAQHKFGMDEISLIICDEAHRTAGGHYQDESDAPFQRIHSDDFIKGKKRLYMTATPRIYGDVVKEQKDKGEVVLYSMDDEQIYGPTFHTITFSQAVALGSLVDYKVIVLSVEENILKERALSDYELVQTGGLPVKHAAKVIGCWRALSKLGSKEFSCLMTNCIVDLQLNFNGQCFPRWLPGEQGKTSEGILGFDEPSEIPSGFSPEALPHFQAAYPGKTITEDDLFYYIYGILHSEDFRMRYANNLMKELPRIPRVATYEQFVAFVQAGQGLGRLHVHFEEVEPYDGVTIEYTKSGQPSYRVKQMKWGKIKGKTGNAAKDKTTLIYNDWITVKNVPLEAQEYVVNKKSALDWVVERACVSIDKASGIVNDFNDYAAEMGNERYPLDLFLKIITVSLETMKIVKSLPKLEIHPLDK